MKSISESIRGMAVVIASVMLAATIFTMPVKAAEPTTYIQSGTIWSESAGEYQVLDDAGELWGFTAGVYDYVVGQYVEMTMSDAGTQTISMTTLSLPCLLYGAATKVISLAHSVITSLMATLQLTTRTASTAGCVILTDLYGSGTDFAPNRRASTLS